VVGGQRQQPGAGTTEPGMGGGGGGDQRGAAQLHPLGCSRRARGGQNCVTGPWVSRWLRLPRPDRGDCRAACQHGPHRDVQLADPLGRPVAVDYSHGSTTQRFPLPIMSADRQPYPLLTPRHRHDRHLLRRAWRLGDCCRGLCRPFHQATATRM